MYNRRVESIKELRKICQAQKAKTETRMPWVRFVRIFSIYLTWVLLHTKITPNKVTLIGTFFCVTAPFLFILEDYTWNMVGIGLYLFGYVLDYCDGEIARYRKTAGRGGLWFVEPATHDIQYAFIGPPIGIAAFVRTGNVWMIALGFGLSLAKLLIRSLESKYQVLKLLAKENKFLAGDSKIWHREKKAQANDPQPKLYAQMYLNIYGSMGFTVFMIVAAVTQRFDVFVWFYGVTLPIVLALYFIRLSIKSRPFL
jgi:hypothetical protein